MKYLITTLLLVITLPMHANLQLVKKTPNSKSVMICLHGYGSSGENILEAFYSYPEITDDLIAFDFPDANIMPGSKRPEEISYGTIHELLPAISVIKKVITEHHYEKLNLCGFSAGGGAIVNLIAVLNTTKHDEALSRIGVGAADKKMILGTLQKGLIILDCPLKSMDEIVAFRGQDPELMLLAKRYQENGFTPLDALKNWEGLSLTVLVHFQQGDEILSNRDDALFIERLKQYNSGETHVVIGNDGGHVYYHKSLWKAYQRL